jgi:phosphate-selective porin
MLAIILSRLKKLKRNNAPVSKNHERDIHHFMTNSIKRLSLLIAISSLLSISAFAQDRDPLVNLLIKKGVLTEQEVIDMESELKQEASTKAADTTKAKTDNFIKSGYGNMKVNALFQGWGVFSNKNNSADTFKLRRSEIKFSGDVTDKLHWAVMVDPAKELKTNKDNSIDQKSRMLQDLKLTYDVFESNKINFGQFKVPISMEGLESSGKIDTIDRARFISDGKLGDYRDIGVMWEGDYKKIGYALGVFNGEGQNTSDLNDNKDVSGRFLVRPLEGLQLGTSFYVGKSGTALDDKDRFGLEGKYVTSKYALKAEYMHAKDGSVSKEGWYGLGTYNFTDKWQGVARIEGWNPDTDNSNNKENDYTVGVNYFLNPDHTKLQLNYIRRDYSSSSKDDENIIMTAVQFAL